jgi:hypothetical protein
MNKATKIKYYIESLCIYNLKNDEIIRAIYSLLDSIDSEDVLANQSELFRLLSQHKSLKHYISKLILTDDNVFTKSACAGTTDKLDNSIIDGVKSDLAKLEEIASLCADDIVSAEQSEDLEQILQTMPKWTSNGKAMLPLTSDWANQIEELKQFHKTNGYGNYAKYFAFTWRDKSFVPITTLDPITLADLKNYEKQRKQVVDNTHAFLENLPANNILLYGDRGTGKSSTVHAILNEYKNQGLRMIEISKGDINELTLIRERISDSPMKFIIFIDDLSFDSHEDSFGELKAALEGSLSGRQNNTIIYATSNRRHLIKENFSDRDNDVNRSDTLQEELSLSDRFGLSITFINPDKSDYLDIVEKIATDRQLNVDMDKLCAQAEVWARRRGGRSPRCAKQFIDHVEACVKRGYEW